MKLSASRFARWFVQGERACVSSEQAALVFKLKDQLEVYPFASWDGRCHIERGLVWGKMSFELSPSNETKQTITVYGLPWRKINRCANELAVEYQTWLKEQREYLSKSENDLLLLQKELDEHRGYLRYSDFLFWEQKATKKLKSLDIQPQILSILNPSLYQTFYGWLIDSEKRRNERNEWWFRRELQQWQTWFRTIEKAPLNYSQQKAILMGENNTLVLAGAGSGKTSVLTARARYLVESQQCQPEEIVVLAFGKKASNEMKQRLNAARFNEVYVATFHGFAMRVIQECIDEKPIISPLATDAKAKKEWMAKWLEDTFNHPTSHKRWINHLEQWSIAGLNSKKILLDQTNKPALHKWLWRHLDLLLQHSLPMTALKKMLIDDVQASSELTLLMPLLTQYQRHLSDNGEYDFHGLIARATDLVSRSNGFAQKFAHVLVDEFQDISPARIAFLEALCKQNPERTPSLFAVGDDWQAIYRFAGADVNLTSDFTKHFPSSNILFLDMTYRFNSKIGDVANPFIQANPKQLLKELKSHDVQYQKSVYLIGNEDVEDVLMGLTTETEVELEDGINLMLIGRNNKNKPKNLSDWQKKWPKIKMEYVTAHSSKGLEADYSIILDVNEGVFPAVNKEAGLEYMLLTDFEEIEHAEERRLFYVAMTRARHACWICCDPNKPSVFVNELMQGYPIVNLLKDKQNTKRKPTPVAEESKTDSP